MIAKRLLSVDDDPAILALIRDVAGDLGFEVECLSSSMRFMTTYVRMKPDVITLDVMMPEMDGIEIVQWLNDVESTASVIILSGGGSFARVAKTFADTKGTLRATILPKPCKIADLRAALVAAAESAPKAAEPN